MKLTNVIYESGKYFILKNKNNHYEVYRLHGNVFRCAYINEPGELGFARALHELSRRQSFGKRLDKRDM